MKVVVCPDSFTGTLTARDAADAMAVGWLRVHPHDELVLRPLSDGGPGFLEAVAAGRGGLRRVLDVPGPTGAPVRAEYLVTPDATAWVESAQAAGLHLVAQDARDPTRTTSSGVGVLIAAALAEGCRRLVVGVGGTGTCDGGSGLLAALGATSTPALLLDRGGAALLAVQAVDLSAPCAAIGDAQLELASDVDVPLLGPRGAARGFAPQKGATPAQVEQLELSLAHWAGLLGRTPAGRSPSLALGAGAGGGIGAALIRLGASRVPGISTVLAAAHLERELADADLVLTGEGAFDWQSLRGKVVAGVAARAGDRAVPTVVLAGRVEVSRRQWVAAGVAGAYPAAAEPGQTPAEGLARAAERVARTWGRRR